MPPKKFVIPKKKIVMPKIKKIKEQPAEAEFFNEQAALYSNKISRAEALDEYNKKTRIQLPESFTMTKPKAIDENKFVDGTKTTEWTDYVNNDVKNVRVLKEQEGAKLKKEFNYHTLTHENYKFEQKVNQEVARHNPVALIAQYAESIYNAFGNSYAALNEIGLLKSIAQLLAPKPTEAQEQAIKQRILKMDHTLITDYYAISQAIQSPFLNNYINSFYTQFQEFKEGHEYKFIMSFIKSIVNYVSLNKDKIGIPSFISKFWNVFYGTQYTAAPTTPPYTENFTMPPVQFTSDATLAPSERVGEVSPPPPPPTPEPMPTPEPITQPPTRAPLVGNMPVIYEAYIDAFTTREKLVMFYNNLLGVGMSQAFMQIKQYVSRAPGVFPLVAETPTNILTTNLIGALNYIGTAPEWVIIELTTRANEINTDPAFFFQPSPLKTSPEQSRGDILDYNELKNQIYKALESRYNLDSFIMDTGNKPDYLKNYPTFKKYIIDSANKLDSEQGGSANLWQISSKIFFDMIYNGLITLNDPSLSEFISTIGNEMNILVNDPKFSLEPGDIPYDIKSERLTPQPRTATDATRPRSVPQLPTANANIILTKNEPQNINLVSKTGAAPVSEKIENIINLSLIVPKKDKKYIDEMGGAHVFIMDYLFSLYTTLFNLGVGGLTKLFEQLPLIKKPKETAEYLGEKFPPLTIGGGITIAIKAAYNLIKNIKMKKDQTKFIFSFINNIKSIEDIKTMFVAIQSNTIYFDVLADQILKNIKDKQELEITFGKDTLRQKVIDTLMKSFINVNENNRLDTDFYEQTLTNVLISLQELVNY